MEGNELKLTQLQLFSFFFKRVATNVTEMLCMAYTLKKSKLKMTHFRNRHFITVIELKLTQIELVSFFHFKMCRC